MHVALTRLIFILIAMCLATGAYLIWAWNHTLTTNDELIEIKPKMTLKAIANQLVQRKILPESYSFVLLAYLTGHDRDLKSGEYRFPHGVSSRDILETMIVGQVVKYPLVLLEGRTFSQFVQTLAEAPKLSHTLSGLKPENIMERLGKKGEHPEGRFFPDTYYYSAGESDLKILANAYEKMERMLQQEWDKRDEGLPLKDPYSALILASIVEKETGRANERKIIAGVFINRLRRGMRLQSDPSVIYGLGEQFDGNIRSKDLKSDTPYNTYTRPGLPPTPVSMPGKDSLLAVLHPEKTSALYFVARGDGTHEFSSTLDDHNKAVIKYQLKGKPRN